MDLLEKYSEQIDLNSITNIRSINNLSNKKWKNFNKLINDLPSNNEFKLIAKDKEIEIKY